MQAIALNHHLEKPSAWPSSANMYPALKKNIGRVRSQ